MNRLIVLQAHCFTQAATEYDWIVSDSFALVQESDWAKSIGGTDEAEWRRMMGAVHSRTFRLVVNGNMHAYDASKNRLMVPVFDQVNESNSLDGHNVDWSVDSDEGMMLLYAKRDVEPGEEALTSYGGKSNDTCLLYYGFVSPDNPADSVPLFESTDNARQWAAFQMQQNNERLATETVLPAHRGDRCSLGRECEVDEPLVQAIYEGAECSNMVECGQLLQRRCNEILNALPTDAQTDARLLTQSESVKQNSSMLTAVILFRKLRKDILHEFASMVLA